VRRRDFISLALGAAAWPGVARAQQSARMKLLGILLFAEQDRPTIAPLLKELETLGYADGKTVAVEYRIAGGDYDRLPKLATELVDLGPDVIFSFSGELAPIIKQATSTIPVVVVVSNDPVASGLVSSLSHPGGNITGVTYVHDQLAGKVIELLHEAAPNLARFAMMWNPNHADPEFRATQKAARTLGLELQSLEVRQPADFDRAFKAAASEKAEALIVAGSRLMALQQHTIADFAASNRMILAGTPAWVANAGGLLSYGPDVAELHRRAAGYVDKILRGARPVDLPIQQPVKFELVVNLKAAEALGVTIAPTILALADGLIQ
jgi:putative tryptophan/tyrosine transport system substrate-binding protein